MDDTGANILKIISRYPSYGRNIFFLRSVDFKTKKDEYIFACEQLREEGIFEAVHVISVPSAIKVVIAPKGKEIIKDIEHYRKFIE